MQLMSSGNISVHQTGSCDVTTFYGSVFWVTSARKSPIVCPTIQPTLEIDPKVHIPGQQKALVVQMFPISSDNVSVQRTGSDVTTFYDQGFVTHALGGKADVVIFCSKNSNPFWKLFTVR